MADPRRPQEIDWYDTSTGDEGQFSPVRVDAAAGRIYCISGDALQIFELKGSGAWDFHVRGRDKAGRWGPTKTMKVRMK